MSVYVVIEIKILKQETYKQYIERVPAIIKQYGGRYLARGEQITPLFGNWHPERMILLEFDDLEKVHAWLSSPEYVEVSPLRASSTITRAVVIEGLSQPM